MTGAACTTALDLPQAKGVSFYEREPGVASRPLPEEYRRHEPEKTVLYQLVQEHLETMLDNARSLSDEGTGYPKFVEKEFRRYLDCGILAKGFARLRCPSCGKVERIVPFSCKGRLCPSCLARRAGDTAAHLVDRVFPEAPYRQWVLTFPWPLRFLLAVDKTFLTKMLRIFLRTIFAWQRLRGRRLGIQGGETGAVTFVQRFGGSLNTNPHFHSLLPDGLFVPGPSSNDPAVFVPLPPPEDEDIRMLMVRLLKRLKPIALKRLEEAGEEGAWQPSEDTPFHTLVAEAMRLPMPRGPKWEEGSDKPLCAKADGFSLHAARFVTTEDREGLEGLCRYGLRAPLALDRLSIDAKGNVEYRLKTPWASGRTHLTFEPLAFLKRLAALVPAPYTNLTRYHGVFSNRSRIWPTLPKPPQPPGALTEVECAHGQDSSTAEVGPSTPANDAKRSRRPRRLSWAQLMKRVLDKDVLTCPHCQVPMVILAFISDPPIVRRILDHLGLPSKAPALAPARDPYDEETALFQSDIFDDRCEWEDSPSSSIVAFPQGRAPPRADAARFLDVHQNTGSSPRIPHEH